MAKKYSIPTINKATLEIAPERTMTAVEVDRGYAVRKLDPMANEYTNQHNTTFYDEVKRKDDVTGEEFEGFLERGNFLDRL
jgi:hypothetical protein